MPANRTAKVSSLRIVYIPLNQLVPLDVNPTVRTEARPLDGLLKLLTAPASLMRCPLQVHTCKKRDIQNVVVDGNRRFACLRLIYGNTTPDILVPCIIHTDDCTSAELFAELNAGNRPMSRKEWMFVWVRSRGCLPDERVPPKILTQLQDCVSIFGGRNELEFLIRHDTSPGVSTTIRRFINKIREELGTGYKVPPKRVGQWIVVNHLQADVNVLCKSGISTAKLKRLYHIFRAGSSFSLGEFIEE